MKRKDILSYGLTAVLVLGLVVGALALWLQVRADPVRPWWESDDAFLPDPPSGWDERWDAQYDYSLARAQAWLEENRQAVENAAAQTRLAEGHLEILQNGAWREAWSGQRLELELEGSRTVVCYPYRDDAFAEEPSRSATSPLDGWHLSIPLEERSGGAVGFTMKSSLYYSLAAQDEPPYRHSDEDMGEYACGQSLSENWRYGFFYDR